jgi:hypothetical protein
MNDVLVNHYRCPAGLLSPAAPAQSAPGPEPESVLAAHVELLRRELYPAARSARIGASLPARAYYSIRPLLGLPVRKHLQRLWHRRWKEIDFPAWPVDTTVERLMGLLLAEAMRRWNRDPMPFIWFWPDGAPACVSLTHDVETAAGVSFTPRLMDLDGQFGIPASFQVIPEKQYQVTNAFLGGILSRGFELNVQDLTHEGNLFSSREEFLARSKFINNYLHEWGSLGFRAGRMYRNTEWFDALNIAYDMSIPNTARLDPQRGGCCTVFPYFLGQILELPLTTTQDYTLLHILGEYSLDLWKVQTALILKEHGLATFLVHPDYIREPRALALYAGLLGHLAALRESECVWIAPPGEVNRWWRQRSQMTLVQTGDVWRIEGPGSERARIAWASIRNGEAIFAVERTSEARSCQS